jgi:hypothetical protein
MGRGFSRASHISIYRQGWVPQFSPGQMWATRPMVKIAERIPLEVESDEGVVLDQEPCTCGLYHTRGTDNRTNLALVAETDK